MTQRKKPQSIVLLMIVVLSAVSLWALVAVAWPVPVVYAADPEIITITVTSSLETYLYDPGLGGEGGTVYFNSLAGEGAGQVLTVTVICSGTVTTFEGDSAFGDNPLSDDLEPWEITYTVGMDAGTQSGIVFTVTNAITETDTAVITFTQDNVDPGPPTSPQARPDDYIGTGEYDNNTEVYFTWAAASDPGGSGIATYYAEIGGSTPDEDAGMDFEDTDTGAEGLNAYYVAAVDNVGNVGSAVSDTITIDTILPSITGITVTSDSPTFFHDPGLGVTGGEVFFNSLAGEGGGQTIAVTVSFNDANPYRLEGDTVFGDSPVPDTSGPPWTLSYSIGTGAISETNRVFTVTDWAGNTDTAAINFTQDNTDPTVEFDDVTDPDYDSAGDERDDDGSNWYDPDNLSAGWYFTYTATDTSSDLALANASWDHSNDIYDQPINDPGLDGDGVFTGVDDDGDGMVTVTLTITDNVGNSASDTVVFNLDDTEPIITDPQIDETSDFLHADGLTIYYGDDMPGSRAFTVQGGAQDDVGGVGLYRVTYSAALNQGYYEDSTHLENWHRDYTANQYDTTSGVITVTVYDRVGNFATQFFTYTRDTISPILSGPFTIVENSDYLYATGTTVYYSDRMGGTSQSFTVQGNASDSGGTGLYRATFSSPHLNDPGDDTDPAEWSGTYGIVESTSGTDSITVSVYDNVGNWSEQTFDYIEDTTNPTVDLTYVTPPGYDENTNPRDTDGSNWYNAGDFTAGGGGGWAFTSDTGDGSGAGLDSGAAVWDHSANQTDRTLNCGSDGDGTFSSVSGDGDGTVTVTVVITDRVGNPASDSVLFNIDNTEPTITSPSIYCVSEHLHVEGLTVYYGDDVVGLEGFRVQGYAQDTGGVGLDYVSYSAALGESPTEDHDTPVSPWSRDYTVEPGDDESGVITATVYDFLGNFAAQTFTYIHDADGPTSVASSPQYDNASPIVVTYVNATDTGGSGLKWTELWYKKDSGSWADSGLPPQTGPSGSFNFVPTEGDGIYYFASVATDKAGNQEATPTGSGDTETIYDTTKPSVPGNFAYQNDSDSGGDGIAPLPGYYDDTKIQLRWDASTDGGSGLLPTNPYHLGTAPQPTGGSYAEDSSYDVGSSGTHSIYLTAEDNAGNISDDAVTGPVVVDTGRPQVNINCPESTTEFSFVVGWSATDQGPAGLRSTDPYAVSYQVDGGAWRSWIAATSAVTVTFGPDSPVVVDYDHTYCFRMRAVDKAGNVQYTDGKDCTKISRPDIKKIFLPIVMAPGPNWGFETGDFASWQHGGELLRSVSTADRHSGRYAALLGSPSYACNGVPVGSAWLRRWVEVPSSGSPTLSFHYRIFTQDKTSSQYLGVSALNAVPSGDRFAVYINGSQVFADANTDIEETCNTMFDLGWKDESISLTDYMGTTIEITFYNYSWPDKWYNTYTYLDDVSVQ